MAQIGIDLDGVCYNFEQSLARWLISQGHKFPEGANIHEAHCYEFYESWGLPEEEFVKVCNEAADAGALFTGPAMWGVKEAFDLLTANGHDLHIITNRFFGTTPASSWNNTREWTFQHGLQHKTLSFSKAKDIMKLDYFIEDNPDNYDALEAAGVEVYLVDRLWNQRKDSRRRIDGIRHFADKVLYRIKEKSGNA